MNQKRDDGQNEQANIRFDLQFDLQKESLPRLRIYVLRWIRQTCRD